MKPAAEIPRIPTNRPSFGEQEPAALNAVLDSCWLGTGALTQQFEAAVSEFLGATHVVAVNSGTAALHIALEALGIGEGDEVIVPSFTFVSTIQAILAAGARPVFCEVNLADAQFDTEDASRRITPQTKAFLPVHYGGACTDMDRLLDLADRHGIPIVEDAAHAFGSSWKGCSIGTLGDIGCFSFDPIKNITCGTGGAAVTNSNEIAARLRLLSNVGMEEDSWTRLVARKLGTLTVGGRGYRYRMVDLNAAIGLSQLPKANQFRERKKRIVSRYDSAFSALPGIRLLDQRGKDDVFPFNYAIRVLGGRQTALADFLRTKGIGTTVHFMPNHLHLTFAEYASPLPATEQLFREILTLPLYSDLADKDVDYVIDQVSSFFDLDSGETVR
jgi:perosamine synthetase